MKNETIFNLEILLEYYENIKLDLESDYNNSELRIRKDIIWENQKQNLIKIKEIKNCIKWLKTID